MQWDDSVHAGFSFGKDIEPYLPVNSNYTEVSVTQQLEDPESIFNFYRRLINIRRNSDALIFGSWKTLIHYPYEHLVYVRETQTEKVLIVINFSYEKSFEVDEDIEPEQWQVLISNVWEADKIIDLPQTLQPFEITILKKS